jgi:hypothetical protein
VSGTNSDRVGKCLFGEVENSTRSDKKLYELDEFYCKLEKTSGNQPALPVTQSDRNRPGPWKVGCQTMVPVTTLHACTFYFTKTLLHVSSNFERVYFLFTLFPIEEKRRSFADNIPSLRRLFFVWLSFMLGSSLCEAHA